MDYSCLEEVTKKKEKKSRKDRLCALFRIMATHVVRSAYRSLSASFLRSCSRTVAVRRAISSSQEEEETDKNVNKYEV